MPGHLQEYRPSIDARATAAQRSIRNDSLGRGATARGRGSLKGIIERARCAQASVGVQPPIGGNLDGGDSTAATLAIIDVVNRYGAAIDAWDWERLRSCFTLDATLQFPGRLLHGPDEIVAFITGATGWIAWQHHLLGSHQVTVEGERGRATSVLFATQVPLDESEPARTTQGVYHDQLRSTAEGWRIVHREFRVGRRQ